MSPHQPMDSWAIRFANFINRMGTLKVSVMFVLLALSFTLLGSYVLRLTLTGEVELMDFFSAIVLTLLSAPFVLFFFSELVKQLERQRVNLEELVAQLERLRDEDVLLNQELHSNITQLNYEIEQRKQVQIERETLYQELEQEIKERREKEQQAQRLSSLLRSIIDSSPDLIYYRNEQGQFAGCNRVAEQMTGKTEAELLGLTPEEVYDEDVAIRVVASDNEVLKSNTSITEELWLKFADGSLRYYEMRKVPFYDSEGNRLGLLAFGRDMTKRKEAEDALERASRDKTAFIATISHELRTPLNGIVGLSRMLRGTKLDSEQQNWVNTIYTSAVTLGNIFNDIIDLDKIGRTRLELVQESIDIRLFFNELSSLVGLLAGDKSLTFNASIDKSLPTYIETDHTRLRQILWNLLYNAVKFTERGGVTFQLTVQDDSAEPMMKFVITDSGIGIPEAELDNIFAMYYQVKEDKKRFATGTGIGLAITKKMVDLMGGSIQVNSKPGKGSTFTVLLPLKAMDAPKPQTLVKATGLHILLVEDIELNVMVARALLEKLGQVVSVAMTGGEAIDMARQQHFDLILLDIQLPDMTGFDVANTLLQEDLVMGTPMVALTANVIKTRQEYLDNGMDDVIAKPIKKSRVIEIINQYCSAPEIQDVEDDSQPQDNSIAGALDTENLSQLVDTIGAQLLLDSVEVFKSKMPQYLQVLQTSLMAKDKNHVCEEAHKIKGAAASVGLLHVRKYANLIQQGEHPAWWENVYDWVDELQASLQHDLPLLENWLHTQLDGED